MTFEEGNIIICPYCCCYLSTSVALQSHLIRCRRRYPNSHKVHCQYNVGHIVNEQEYALHLEVCPQRQVYEALTIPSAARLEAGPTTLKSENTEKTYAKVVAQMPDEQRWDDEPDRPSYDPQVYAKNANILRSAIGLSRRERLAFRESERRRLQKIQARESPRDDHK